MTGFITQDQPDAGISAESRDAPTAEMLMANMRSAIEVIRRMEVAGGVTWADFNTSVHGSVGVERVSGSATNTTGAKINRAANSSTISEASMGKC
jgi:hypothetical protein